MRTFLITFMLVLWRRKDALIVLVLEILVLHYVAFTCVSANSTTT